MLCFLVSSVLRVAFFSYYRRIIYNAAKDNRGCLIVRPFVLFPTNYGSAKDESNFFDWTPSFLSSFSIIVAPTIMKNLTYLASLFAHILFRGNPTLNQIVKMNQNCSHHLIQIQFNGLKGRHRIHGVRSYNSFWMSWNVNNNCQFNQTCNQSSLTESNGLHLSICQILPELEKTSFRGKWKI